MADRYRLIYQDGFLEDLRELAEQAETDAAAARRVRVALNALEELKLGTERGTHKLGFMTTYPDLSDCETTYLGLDPVRRPDGRLVWRELPPATAGDLPRRQVIVLGAREGGEVYHEAGRRLGRQPGVRLENLPAAAERAAADRDTLRRVRESARDQQQQAIQDEHNRVIGRGDRERDD